MMPTTSPDAMPPAMTTGQAMKLLRVSRQTVIRMCDLGLIPSFLIPAKQPTREGGGHRRITREAVFAQMKAWGLPIPGEEVTQPKDQVA